MSGVIPTRIWMWSGIELICMTFCFLLWMMPVMYLWSSDLCCLGMRGCRPFTENTMCM